jgi:hypothetical protein
MPLDHHGAKLDPCAHITGTAHLVHDNTIIRGAVSQMCYPTAFIRKWHIKHRAVADSLEEAGLRPDQHAQEPPPAKAGVDGWQTLASKLIDQPMSISPLTSQLDPL